MRPWLIPASEPVPCGTAEATPAVPTVATPIASAATIAVFLPLQRGGAIAGEAGTATCGCVPVGTCVGSADGDCCMTSLLFGTGPGRARVSACRDAPGSVESPTTPTLGREAMRPLCGP